MILENYSLCITIIKKQVSCINKYSVLSLYLEKKFKLYIRLYIVYIIDA